VAVAAFGERDSPELVVLVALFTGELGMFSAQRIARRLVVEMSLLPAALRMALGTVLLELTLVRVVSIARVTVSALPERDSAELLIDVAPGTDNVGVLSEKRKARLLVIELERRPGRFGVASPAVVPEARPVRVLVTIGALSEGEAPPLLIRVALLALHLLVGSREPEAGAAVFEGRLVESDVHRMALGAIVAQLPTMDVFVAGGAASVVEEERRRVGSRGRVRRSMTGVAARDAAVKAGQGITGLGVIEAPAVPAYECNVEPLMVVMTSGALELGTMVSAILLDADPEVLVAREAFVGTDAFSRRMTGRAIVESGDVRVRAGEWTGRDQRVQLPRRARRRRSDSGEAETNHERPPFLPTHHHRSP